MTIYLFNIYIHASIYISIHLSIYLDEGVSYDPGTNDPEEFESNIAQIDNYLSIHLSIYLFIHLPIYLSIY